MSPPHLRNTAPASGSWSRTWDGLASPELGEALSRLASVRRLAEREALYERGDPGRDLYGVRAGYVRLGAILPDGHEGLIGLYGPGTWFGEVSFFDERPRPSGAYAVADGTEVLVVPAAKLRAVLDQNPVWYRDFARVLCNKLRLALAHIEGTMLPVSVRLALRLLDLAQVYGRAGGEGVVIGLRLPQEELGRMLGLTRQSVNKELRALEERGWLRLGRGEIALLDVPALRRHVLDHGGQDLLAP